MHMTLPTEHVASALPQPVQQSPHVRLTHIDGLRGLAAVAVMVSHYLEQVGKILPASNVRTAIDVLLFGPFCLGRLGVVAFFCVSGFVIPFSFPRRNPLRGFVVSRLFRLYPAYWLAVCAAALAGPAAGYSFTTGQLVANLTMLQKVFGQGDMNGVFWTLRVELVFYALCALLFLAGRLHDARVQFAAVLGFMAAAGAIGLLHVLKPGFQASNAMPTYLAAMHFGTLCRLHYLEGNATARKLFWPALAFLLVANTGANLLGYVGMDDLPVTATGANTGYAAGVLLFLACVHYRLFRRPALVWLGAISYSLYLFHGVYLPVVPIAAVAFGLGLPAFAVSVAAMTVLAFATSWLVYRFVELPAVRRGRAVNGWLDDRPTKAGTGVKA